MISKLKENMAKYIALLFALLLVGGGFYGLNMGHESAGGFTILFGLVLSGLSILSLLGASIE